MDDRKVDLSLLRSFSPLDGLKAENLNALARKTSVRRLDSGRVLFKEGEAGDYYIERAGSYLQKADKGRARVQLANGEILTRGGKFLFFGGGLPEPDPGSIITVPLEEEKPPGPGALEMIAVLTAMITATATVIIAASK
jgi:CRP-like cAMP-binding protein